MGYKRILENGSGKPRKKNNRGTYPACNDDPTNHRHQTSIGNPSFPLEGHEISKQGSEERSGGTDSLIEGHRKVSQRDIPTHNRCTEDNAESRNPKELGPRFDSLIRANLHYNNGDVTEDGTSRHMTHCEENWEGKAIIGEQELV